MNIPENCWVWDGYLGKCVKYHPAQWWQYANAASITASIAAIIAAIVVALIILDWRLKR